MGESSNIAYDFKPGSPITVDESRMTPVQINTDVITVEHLKRLNSTNGFLKRKYGKLYTFGMPFKLARRYRKILIRRNPNLNEEEINQALFDLAKSLKIWILDANLWPGWDHYPITVADFDYKPHLDDDLSKDELNEKPQSS